MQLLCDLPATMMIPLPPRTLVRGGEGLGVGGSLAGDIHRNTAVSTARRLPPHHDRMPTRKYAARDF